MNSITTTTTTAAAAATTTTTTKDAGSSINSNRNSSSASVNDSKTLLESAAEKYGGEAPCDDTAKKKEDVVDEEGNLQQNQREQQKQQPSFMAVGPRCPDLEHVEAFVAVTAPTADQPQKPSSVSVVLENNTDNKDNNITQKQHAPSKAEYVAVVATAEQVSMASANTTNPTAAITKKKKKAKRKQTGGESSNVNFTTTTAGAISSTTMDTGTATSSALHNEVNYSAILEDYKVATSIVDINVVRAVHHIQTMLQIYGPLTYAQLKHNLPTSLVGLTDNNSNKLQQILDILVALGILNVVDEEKTAAAAKSRTNTNNNFTAYTEVNTNTTKKQDATTARSTATTRYVFLMKDGGPPRFDNITVPNEVAILNKMAEINVEEITDRIKLLRQELIQTGPTRRRTAHPFLSELMQKYPSLQEDTLFSAALENAQRLGADI